MKAPERSFDRAHLRGRLILLLAVVVIASVVAVGFAALSAFDRAIEPELANRTRLIGSIVRAEVQRALELGIPIDSIRGLDLYLDATLAKFDEVDRIIIATASGDTVAAIERGARPALMGQWALGEVSAVLRTSFVLPILQGNNLVGGITVVISPLFIQTRLRDVFLDVSVLALIAILVALELALALTISSVGKPLDRVFQLLGEQQVGDFRHVIRQGGLGGLGRTAAQLNDHAEDLAARVVALPRTLPQALRGRIGAVVADGKPRRLRLSDFNDIRLALFLFSCATEIAAAFLPLYARAADRPTWITPEIAAAAPLIVYLVAVAALAPFGGRLARRFGPRRLFLGSVLPTAAALLAMGFSGGLVGITLGRGVLAVFYATATIACQEYALRAIGARASARPFTAFVAVISGGVFCGSALGGLIAGRLGFEAAFAAGAALALISGIMGAAAMRGRAGDRAGAVADGAGSDSEGRRGWISGRFLALLLGIAAPMNASTAVFIWCLTPLMLAAAGSGPAEIGRVVMLYHLSVVLFAPTVARVSDGRLGPGALVLAGAVISGGALLSLAFWGGFWAVAGAVAGLGFGHTLIRAPVYVLARATTGGRGLDALRLIERLGAILGLVAGALLLGRIGAGTSLLALSLAVLAGAALYAIVALASRPKHG